MQMPPLSRWGKEVVEMREIKYRAWDIKAQKMSMVTGLTFGGGQYSKDNIKLVATGIDRKYGQNYEVMQFTGLKDKHGVDIFDGDIVRTPDGYEVIEWEDDRWLGRIGEARPMIASFHAPKDREIIGNVWENGGTTENLDSKADYQASVDEDRFQQEQQND